jgi:gamma-glutamyltranspeptidase
VIDDEASLGHLERRVDQIAPGKLAELLMKELGTAEDVKNYRAGFAPPWTPGAPEGPATATYRGYEVGPPSVAMLGLAFNLFEVGDLRSRGRPTESADTLYYQMRIMQELWHTGLLYRQETHDLFHSKDYARQVWRLIESGPPRPFDGFAEGTCALTIVDAAGNVAGGTHSSSSTSYGTGLFVDGVILNRVIYLRKYKLPNGIATNVWLFKEGKPALTVASPSRAFTEALLQAVANVVEFGMDLGTAVSQPRFGHPDPAFGAAQIEGSFAPELVQAVRKRGMKVLEVSPENVYMGSCHAVQIDRANGTITGAADPRRRGLAKAI